VVSKKKSQHVQKKEGNRSKKVQRKEKKHVGAKEGKVACK
jgi:hypothetical protein